jgi:Flp pilus assembly protein TadD
LYVQSSTLTVISLENLPLATRLSNVVVSLVRYIGKMLWPVNLAVHYPHPKDTLPPGLVAACAALLLFITVTIIVLHKRAPYGIVGWFWYLGAVLPVIGVIQVGTQGMADRYTYIPMIGCSILVAWGVPDLLARAFGFAAPKRWLRDALWATAIVLVCGMSLLTFRQIGVWKDTETLWRHAVRVTRNNDVACRNLAMFEIEKGRFDAAVPLLETTVRVNPADEAAYYFLGLACHRLGRLDSAESYYRQALRLDPTNIDTMNGLGLALLSNKSFERAIETLRAAHEADPARADTIANYGAALCAAGRHGEALPLLESAVKTHPDDPVLRNVLAIALHGIGRTRDAVEQVRKALELRPDYLETQRNLEFLESQLGPPDV